MISVGVIGCGQWGPNHVRNFSHLSHSRALMCADVDEKRLSVMKQTFLNIQPVKDYREILKNKEIQAVCIAAPTSFHYQMTKEALEHGKDVLCEKPLATTCEQAQELMELAQKENRILMVGHVFLFNTGIQKLKSCIKQGDLGAIQYAHSERTNLGPFRYDVNALWDLAPHDISIFNDLFSSQPLEVSARGHKCLSKDREDVVFISLVYPSNVFVNIHVSWLDPKKVRQITVVGDRKMVIWDDLENVGPIKIYDKHVEKTQPYYESFGDFQLLFSKEGDITIPKLNLAEPLKVQDHYFIDCVKHRKQPELGSAQEGINVIKVLTAAQESIQASGKPITIR